MNNKIIIVTSGQPSFNPRLVKEADALTETGYDVTVLYAYWNDIGAKLDLTLLGSKKWKALCIGGDPIKQPLTYFFSRFIYKLARYFIKNWGFMPILADVGISRSSYFLMRTTKKHKADLYIGHNLGALAAIKIAAKKHNAKCGFDLEDFHRNEVSEDQNSFNYKISKFLEDKYLPALDYITASSPEITNAYYLLYPNKKPVTILNLFPIDRRLTKRNINQNGPIKLFWFSQTIGKNRGIETIAHTLKKLNPQNYELHLLGYINESSKQKFIDDVLFNLQNVYFHSSIPPNEIVNFASRYDIGLAIEETTPFNRDICLTNKLFTYLQAGLAIIASDTTAQKNFMVANHGIGEVYYHNSASITTILTNYHLNRSLLFDACEASLKLGTERLNWENESKKILSVVENILSKSD